MRSIPAFIKDKIRNSICKKKPRYEILDLCMDFCKYNKVEGDYFEFGVWRGDTFQYAFHAAKKRKLYDMHFFAFDSFQGFSKPSGHDDIGLIKEHSRVCPEEEFRENMRRTKVDMEKVTVVPGWFSESLNNKNKDSIYSASKVKKAAIIYIDCDLYEPAFSVLNFATDLIADGTVLIFDDWFMLRGNPERGERKAFDEWIHKNPEIKVTEFSKFGWHGNTFILNI